MNPAGSNAFNLKLILEAGDQRNMQHPPSPIHEQMQSTFATKRNTIRYHNIWSELVAFNDQAIMSESDVQLRWYPDLLCVILVVDTLNTTCEAISSAFDNNYLIFDLKNRFVTFCCITCF